MLLTSCEYIDFVLDFFKADPETADELWDRIDEEMDEIESYRCTTDVSINYEMQGIKVKGNVDIVMVEIGDDDDEDYYSYMSNSADVYVGGSRITDTESVVVYQDGKIYLSNKDGDVVNRLSAEMTTEEFVDYISDRDNDIDLSVENATDKKMEKKDDGEWEISFSIFDEDELLEMLEAMEFDEDMLGFEITGVSVEAVADEDFRVDEMTVTFISGDDEVIVMTARYDCYNSAKRVDIDEPDYEDVDYISAAITVEDYLDDVMDAESLDFDVYITHKVQNTALTEIYYEYEENDSVSFLNKNNAFTYGIEAYLNGEKFSIEYAYGTQTIIGSGSKQTAAQSALEAKSFILNLLDPVSFQLFNVSNIEKLSGDKYRIDLKATNVSDYRQTIISLGDSYVGYELYLVVELDGESVESIITYITVEGRQYVYSIESVVNIAE